MIISFRYVALAVALGSVVMFWINYLFGHPMHECLTFSFYWACGALGMWYSIWMETK